MRRPDVPAEHGDLAALEQRPERGASASFSLANVGRRPAVGVVGDDTATRVYPARLEPGRAEHRREQCGGEPLSLGDDGVAQRCATLGGGRSCSAREQVGQLGAGPGQLGEKRGRPAEQRLRHRAVALEVGLEAVQAPLLHAREQRIGDPAHRRHHDHATRSPARPHDRRGALEGCGVRDRGAAELEHCRAPRVRRHCPSNMSCFARSVALTTALMSVTRSFPSSSSRIPSIVHPAGVVTASLRSAG